MDEVINKNLHKTIKRVELDSLMSIFWLALQVETNRQIQTFTLGVLVGLPATIVMLLAVYIMLKNSLPFVLAIIVDIISWGVFLGIQKLVPAQFNMGL